MSQHELTDRYLMRAVESGLSPAEFTRPAVESDLLMTAYRGDRFLSRPVFLDAGTARGLGNDLARLFRLIADLPRRHFGGDHAAMFRAVGLAEQQLAALDGADLDTPLVPMARADMHRTDEGHKVLELNMGGPLGGYDIGELCRALLRVDLLADFVEREQLTYVDTALQIGHVVMESAAGRDMPSRPFLAVVDWPSSFERIGKRLGNFARLLGRVGFDTAACHAGQVERRDGRLLLDGRPIDIVYRFFLLEDVLESPEAPQVMAPILEAARAGEVYLYTDLPTDAYASKTSLALVSEDRQRGLLDPDDAAVVDRLLPWTRLLDHTETEVGGQRGDLVDYVLDHRDQLILKAPNLHGGMSIVPGWTCDDDTWRTHVERGLREHNIVQRRVPPGGEPFLLPDGTVGDMLLNWGVFMLAGRYGGSVIRATPDPEMGVLSMAAGARVTCTFHESSAVD